MYDHLICYGFVQGYTRWINHGEWEISMNVNCDMDDNVYSYDDNLGSAVSCESSFCTTCSLPSFKRVVCAPTVD